jgi:peptidoglycan/LPS O-acetylase OafA/YrhL
VLFLLGVLSVWSRHQWANGQHVFLVGGLPQYMLWFALGMGLAVVSVYSERAAFPASRLRTLARRPGLSWACAVGLFVLLGALTDVTRGGWFSPSQLMLQWVLDAGIGFFLVLPAVFARPGAGVPGRVLAWRPIAWLGLVSYGIFLWQGGPIQIIYQQNLVHSTYAPTRFLQYVAIAVIATVGLAAVSYYVIERPILRLKDSGSWRRRELAAQPNPL